MNIVQQSIIEQFRTVIVEMHKKSHPFSYLDHIVDKVTDNKKSQYRTAINQYKKIFQKKEIEFFIKLYYALIFQGEASHFIELYNKL